MNEITVVVPYYRNPGMLACQIRTWRDYPDGIRMVVVDDGSPEPAVDVVMQTANAVDLDRIRVYRIGVDIPWNRSGARNLGTTVSETDWILHIDIDHVLPSDAVPNLLSYPLDEGCWYRFPRYRIGAADETRKKDSLSPDAQFGSIKPHGDSYLVHKSKYWQAGGYNENFSGCLGGGSPFLEQLGAVAKLRTFPEPIRLHVYTRHVVSDASDLTLSRDTSEYSRRRRQMEREGDAQGDEPVEVPMVPRAVKYPQVLGEFDTALLLQQGFSLARFGDGELKMSYGAGYSRQEGSTTLAAELRKVLTKPPRRLLVGIPTMDPKGPKYENWTRHKQRFEAILSDRVDYCSAFVTRPDSAPWIESPEFCELLASLWRGKRAVVLCERRGSMLKAVSPEAGEAIHVEAPRYGAYDRVERLEQKIVDAKPEIAILSAGPAATCLASRLTKRGIQAIDLGSAGAMIVRNLYA